MHNRREAVRIGVHKMATIFHGDPKAKLKCIIDDLSSTGAHIRFPSALLIPDTLTLSIPGDNLVLQVDVRWRSHRGCGVQFKQRIAHPLLTLNRMHQAVQYASCA